MRRAQAGGVVANLGPLSEEGDGNRTRMTSLEEGARRGSAVPTVLMALPVTCLYDLLLET